MKLNTSLVQRALQLVKRQHKEGTVVNVCLEISVPKKEGNIINNTFYEQRVYGGYDQYWVESSQKG
ncbi:MAG: hypothetical protein KKD44_29315 [Proteobacteria bacterium]|nr:hypothetical protein [Pseudomonadota bacterium]